MNKEYKNILINSLANMPDEFTSEQFTTICRKYGMSKYTTASGYCGDFLHKNCVQLSKRRWKKLFRDTIKSNNNSFADLNEQKCIDYLKNLGYKIYKPITEYKEI